MGMHASFKTTAKGERIDWKAIRDTISLADVATRLLGPAPGRRGERGRRLWWSCPFHKDNNPSFCIKPSGRRWRCWGCGLKGDAVDLVRRLNPGWTFPEAMAYLTGKPAPSQNTARPRSRPPAGPRARVTPARSVGAPPVAASMTSKPAHPVPGARPPERSSGLPLSDATSLVTEAADRLWKPEGTEALAYLHGRGLDDETIRAARLGWTPRAAGVSWKPPGVVVPWFEGDRLALAKIRPPKEWRMRFAKERRPPKYIEAFRDQPRIFPGPEAIRPGWPLVIVEGEFDALLLGQELRDLAAVVTLGSASTRPDPGICNRMLAAPVWFVAHDADTAGDRSASEWPARAARVRPPDPWNDWTEAAWAGVNLRLFWAARLGRETLWRELAALNGPTPGIIIDRPDPEAMRAALAGADPRDPYALAEREAIQQENKS
jgi:hypothetical protein